MWLRSHRTKVQKGTQQQEYGRKKRTERNKPTKHILTSFIKCAVSIFIFRTKLCAATYTDTSPLISYSVSLELSGRPFWLVFSPHFSFPRIQWCVCVCGRVHIMHGMYLWWWLSTRFFIMPERSEFEIFSKFSFGKCTNTHFIELGEH